MIWRVRGTRNSADNKDAAYFSSFSAGLVKNSFSVSWKFSYPQMSGGKLALAWGCFVSTPTILGLWLLRQLRSKEPKGQQSTGWVALWEGLRCACHLQTITVLLLPFQCGWMWFYFFFLSEWVWPGLPGLCWVKVVKVDMLVLFLFLR